MESQPAAFFSYVGVFGGYEHACRPSISNQIGTNRIPMMRTIDVKGQNDIFNLPWSTNKSEILKEIKTVLFLEFYVIKDKK